MKRYIYFTVILFVCVSCFSQEKKIYIFYNRNSPVEVLYDKKDNSPIEIFKFNLNKDYLSNELSVEKDGTLMKKIRVKSGDNNYLTLKYENNVDNKPLLVKQSEVKNTLYPHEIMAVEYNNLLMALKQYDDIYLVDLESCVSDYCIARKVTIVPALEKL